jgi:hypothetical protein
MQDIFMENFHEKQLKPFRDCILASLLMHYENFVSRYGRGHIVPRNFEEKCRYYDVSPARIVAMGRFIAVDIQTKNKANVHRVIAKKSHNGDAATAQVKRLESLEKENAVLKSKLSNVEGQLSNLQGQMTGMTALMERVWSGVDTLMRVPQPAVPVLLPAHQLTVPVATAIIQPPQTPVAAAAQVGPMNANQVMMMQSKRGRGEWNMKSKELTDMKYSQFLIERRLRGIDLDKKEPPTATFGSQSTVTKKNQAETQSTRQCHSEGCRGIWRPRFEKSATEMKSNKLPPDHATHPAEYCQWKLDIDRMAIQLVAHLEKTSTMSLFPLLVEGVPQMQKWQKRAAKSRKSSRRTPSVR